MKIEYPPNPKATGRSLATDIAAIVVLAASLAHLHFDAAQVPAKGVAAVRAAVTDNGATQVLTSGFTQPAVPRNITATAAGTAGDVKAIQVIIEGTDWAGNVITETLPAFTADSNTNNTVVGTKLFATVTKVTIPAHDGTGATTSIGIGDKVGLPYKLPYNTVVVAFRNKTREATLPTVTVSATDLCDNGFTLNNVPNGTDIDLYFAVN